MSTGSTMRLTYLLPCLVTIGCGEDPTAQLIAQLKDGDVETRCAAVRALESFPAEHVTAALSNAVEDSDHQVRQLAIHRLGQRGEQAKPHLPKLELALNNPDSNTRITAALAIQAIDADNPSFAPILIEALAQGEYGVFLELGEMGSDAAWAVPTLIELTSQRNPRVRALSAVTLGKIGPAAREATEALREATDDPQSNVRRMAEQALALIESPKLDD